MSCHCYAISSQAIAERTGREGGKREKENENEREREREVIGTEISGDVSSRLDLYLSRVDIYIMPLSTV